MKRVISMILCLMLVLGMATTAFAADVTVNNHTSTHSYRFYQVFDGDLDGTVLSNITWGTGVNDDTAVVVNGKSMTLIEAINNLFGTELETATEVAAFLTENSNEVNKANANALAHLLNHYLSDTYAVLNAGETTVKNVDPGYYLVLDATPGLDEGENDARNPSMLKITGHTVAISAKYDVPESDKTITNGASQNVGMYDIGDNVNFELTATMPSSYLYMYDFYMMVMHDTMDPGLTLNPDSFKLYVGTEEVKQATVAGDDQYTNDGDMTTTGDVETEHLNWYTIVPEGEATTLSDGTSFKVVIPDAFLIDAGENDVIKLTYSATVNESVEIHTAIPNEYYLEFSNSPNWYPTTGRETPPTGVTPPKKVETYTGGVVLYKVDGNTLKPLTGAEFTLTGETEKVVVKTEDVFVAYTDTNYVDGNKYWLLTDGKYTDVDPTTAGIDTSVYANDGKVYKLVKGVETVMGAGTESVNIVSYVGADGKLTFNGLGPGNYTITETKTPAGYNTVAPIHLTVVFNLNKYNAGEDPFEYNWSNITDFEGNSVTVRNYVGSTLPETGGMGTTMFYTIGGLMVAAAAILLITKKRMGAEV